MKKRENKYFIYENIVLVECYNVQGDLTRYFICDKDDLNIVKSYIWRIVHKKNGDYVVTGNQYSERKYFHELVLKRENGKEIDHINRDTLDCRKCNLRNATSSEQKANQKMNKRNKSGFRGVSFSKTKNAWVVDFRYKNNRLYFPKFKFLEDAIYIRYQLEIIFFKDYRNKDNDVKILEQINKISIKKQKELDEIIYEKIEEFNNLDTNQKNIQTYTLYKVNEKNKIVPKSTKQTNVLENKNSRNLILIKIDKKVFTLSETCKLLNLKSSNITARRNRKPEVGIIEHIHQYAQQNNIDISKYQIELFRDNR